MTMNTIGMSSDYLTYSYTTIHVLYIIHIQYDYDILCTVSMINLLYITYYYYYTLSIHLIYTVYTIGHHFVQLQKLKHL
jgi:hypothetical protein